MEKVDKTVDGFAFMPPSLAARMRAYIAEEEYSAKIPWTPFSKPLSQATVALITRAGISLKSDPPFDMEKEKREPTWGDRSYRKIPHLPFICPEDPKTTKWHPPEISPLVKVYMQEIKKARNRGK